eukprot:gene35269-45671_t
MFSACVTNLEDSVMAMGGASENHNNGNNGDKGEGDSGSKMVLYDKVLEEGLKLKKKCKSLKNLLQETEDKRLTEQKEFEMQMSKLQGQVDKQMTMLRAQHASDLTQLRDYRSNEVDTLTRKLQATERELQMNNPLVLTLTHKASALETEIEILKQKHEQDSLAWKGDLTELQALVSEKIKAEESAQETNKDILHQLKSALESNERLQKENNRMELFVKNCNQKQVDEINYYKEENSRLEKQVTLIKADLDSYIMNNSGCSADNTTVLSPECSPNPKEKSPAGVPFSQYNAT